jgi:hypothetical protein
MKKTLFPVPDEEGVILVDAFINGDFTLRKVIHTKRDPKKALRGIR